jgi:hypothetical protein
VANAAATATCNQSSDFDVRRKRHKRRDLTFRVSSGHQPPLPFQRWVS